MKSNENVRARLGEFMGHSVVSVIRAMGAAGWNFEEAQTALAKAKLSPAENTIRIQLRAGRLKLAEPADIDSKELKALRPNLPKPEADKGLPNAKSATAKK